MSTTIEEIERFAEFARRTAAGEDNGPTLEECLRMWREQQELEETVAAIKRGEEDFAAGRVMSVEDAGRRIRANLGWPPLSERDTKSTFRRK